MDWMIHYGNVIMRFLLEGPLILWEILIVFLLIIIFLLANRNRKRQNEIRKGQKRITELKKILVIEQDAHRDTQRLTEKRAADLALFGQKIRELRGTTRERERELADQTEELLRLQEMKRTIDKEKAEREKEKSRQEEEAAREQNVLDTIYKYYDDFGREVFSVLDTDFCRGTYHHVQIVASASGMAAERIGLSGAFVRAAAYFHDLGKSYHPKYFKENWSYNEERGWRQENEEYSFYHRGQMILSHLPLGRKIVEERCQIPPTDLMEILAAFPGSNEWKEGMYHKAILAMSSSIEEHQGNTSIQGLFLASIKNGEGTTIEDFSYSTGLKPRSKANGIILLSDSCDAAFEALPPGKEFDVETVIRNVFFMKLSLGLLSETGLSASELGLIFQSFQDFFGQRFKMGDRIEERPEEDRIFYLENKVNPIAECVETIRTLTEDQVAKRRVAYYFAHQIEQLYKLKQVNDLINVLLQDLPSSGKDDIYLANIITALASYYKYKIRDLLDIARENELVLPEFMNEQGLTLQDVLSVPELRNLRNTNSRFEEISVRLNQIKTLLIEAIINKDVLNRTDQYIYKAGLNAYHWLGHQDNVLDPITPESIAYRTYQESHPDDRLISVESGQKFIGEIRGKILEIIPHFQIQKQIGDILSFNVYFKHGPEFLRDENGLFRTKCDGYVAIHSQFLPLPNEDEDVQGIALNFPLAELHLVPKPKQDLELSAYFQLQRIKSPGHIELLFESQETIVLSGKTLEVLSEFR
ncbi:HDIG domain-containing protein [bacterium]|nr:HDIG domain-containing protein [bacterium]